MTRLADLLEAPGTSLEADGDIEAIYDFRARHGADTKAWTAALKAEFDGGIGNFTRQKRDLVERAADTLLVRFNLWEKSA